MKYSLHLHSVKLQSLRKRKKTVSKSQQCDHKLKLGNLIFANKLISVEALLISSELKEENKYYAVC